MNVTDEQVAILKEMQALGMSVSGSAVDNDPRIESDPNPLVERIESDE